MNRASTLEMVLGITIGLVVLAIAAYRSGKTPSKGVVGRGAALGFLAYGVLAAPLLTHHGMSFIGLIVLLIIVGLAIWGSHLGSTREAPVSKTARVLRLIAAIGFASALLIAASQTLSLLGKVDPRVTLIVLLIVVGFLVASQGLITSERISSMALWFMLVPVVLALALGFFLGSPQAAVAPIREPDGIPWILVIIAAAGAFALGWVDGSFARERTLSEWSTKRSAIWALVVGFLFGFGLLMLFGGVVFAPSMEFFVVPANIDALPYLGTLMLAVATVIFGGFIARALTSVGVTGQDLDGGAVSGTASSDLDDPQFTVSSKWVWIGGVIAAVVGLVGLPLFAAMAVAGVAALILVVMSLGSNKPADDREKVAA